MAEPLTPPPLQNAIAEQPSLLTPRVWSRYFDAVRTKVLTSEQRLDAMESRLDAMESRLDALEGTPPLGARISLTLTQSIPRDTPTAIVFDGLDAQDFVHGAFWTTGQPTRLTVPGTSWYSLVAEVRWSPQNAGTREIALRLNGALPYVEVSRIQGENVETDQVIPAVLYLQSGDYLELFAQHGAPGGLTVTAHWTIALMQGRSAII